MIFDQNVVSHLQKLVKYLIFCQIYLILLSEFLQLNCLHGVSNQIKVYNIVVNISHSVQMDITHGVCIRYVLLKQISWS